MKKKSRPKRYWGMNAKELAEATATFEEVFVIDQCTPLTDEMGKRWKKAKRKSSR